MKSGSVDSGMLSFGTMLPFGSIASVWKLPFGSMLPFGSIYYVIVLPFGSTASYLGVTCLVLVELSPDGFNLCCNMIARCRFDLSCFLMLRMLCCVRQIGHM